MPASPSLSERLMDDIEQLSAAASHDLKDPLRLALEHCSALANAIDPSHRASLQQVSRTLEDTLDRIAILRDYAFLVQDTEPVDTVDMRSVIKEATDACQALIVRSNAHIQCDAMPSIQGKRAQLATLVMHLVRNAILYNDSMPPQVTISLQDDGDHWTLNVTDNGMGMEPEYRHLIFGLFRRINPDQEPAGYGAGLAFCRKIAENHRGTITMTSEPDVSTTMTVTLAKQPASL